MVLLSVRNDYISSFTQNTTNSAEKGFKKRNCRLRVINFNFAAQEIPTTMDQITVEALHEKISQGQPVRVLDVREPAEYEANNIGATLHPLSVLRQMDAEKIGDWKDEEIIVHCKSGQRSIEACMLLETMGFTHTVNLIGGIQAWQEKYGEEKLK